MNKTRKRRCLEAFDTKAEEKHEHRRQLLSTRVQRQQKEHPEMLSSDFTDLSPILKQIGGVGEPNNISIFWDFENVTPPTQEELGTLVRSLSHYFRKRGTIQRFTCIGNIDKLNRQKRKVLFAEGVEIKDVPTGMADAADIQILVELSRLVCTTVPHTVVVISNDKDFHPMLKLLRTMGFNIILIAHKKEGEMADEFLKMSEFHVQTRKQNLRRSSRAQKFKLRELTEKNEPGEKIIITIDDEEEEDDDILSVQPGIQGRDKPVNLPRDKPATLTLPVPLPKNNVFLRFGEPEDYIEIDENLATTPLRITSSISLSAYLFLETTATSCCIFQKANTFSLTIKDQKVCILLRIHKDDQPLYFNTGIVLPHLLWLNLTVTLSSHDKSNKRQKTDAGNSPQREQRDDETGRCRLYINGDLAWSSCKLAGYADDNNIVYTITTK